MYSLFDIGKKIKLLRVEKGLTQDALADILGRNPSYVSRMERGDCADFGISEIDKISKVLGVSPAELVGWARVNVDIEIPLSNIKNMTVQELYDISTSE